MRTSINPPPFRFDFRSLLSSARRKFNNRVEGVSINLPFLSFRVCPTDVEQKIAREITIRMADRRVLNAFECCDNCIDQALASLHQIRSFLVDKQVELANATESPLYLVIELQLEAIRQFVTFEQRLKQGDRGSRVAASESSSFRRAPDDRDGYFAALEVLRAHLHRCLLQVAKIADIRIPKISEHMRYDEAWQIEAYETPLEFDKDM